jgi:hypothetical protein
MTPVSARRVALLGLAMVATACDLATFALDPKPIFEETWNLPVTKSSIWVKDLLPSGNVVTIPADSSSFSLKIDSTAISAVLGPNCAACLPLNGTNALKPAFIMTPGNSTSLPQDIVSAAILAGQVSIKLTNNLTFDPLFVNTGGGSPPQGFLVIVVRSGSLVFGRDSVRGAAAVSGTQNAPFPPGSTLTRTINLNTGTVTTNLTVDVTVNSPVGDHLVPINVAKTFDAVASVPFINVGSVSMNVPARTMNSGTGDSLPKMDNKNLVKATLEMTIVNPFPTVTGTLNVKFQYGPGPTQNVTKTITLPAGTGVRSVTLDSLELQTVLQSKSVLTVTGSVSSPTAITVTPKQVLSIDNRLIATVRTPSGGQ